MTVVPKILCSPREWKRQGACGMHGKNVWGENSVHNCTQLYKKFSHKAQVKIEASRQSCRKLIIMFMSKRIHNLLL